MNELKNDKSYLALLSALHVLTFILQNQAITQIDSDDLAQQAASAMRKIVAALEEFNL